MLKSENARRQLSNLFELERDLETGLDKERLIEIIHDLISDLRSIYESEQDDDEEL